jgi:hypothetical protein
MSNDAADAPVAEASTAAAPVDAQVASPEAAKAPEPVRKSCSQGLTGWMRRNRLSIAFTSYQSGRLYLLGTDPKGRLSFHERIYQRAMGIVGNGQRLFMGGLYQIWRFENILRGGQTANEVFDRCYVPRTRSLPARSTSTSSASARAAPWCSSTPATTACACPASRTASR